MVGKNSTALIDPEDFANAHRRYYDLKQEYKYQKVSVNHIIFVSSKTRKTYVTWESKASHRIGEFMIKEVRPGDAHVLFEWRGPHV